MKTIWNILEPDPAAVRQLVSNLALDPLVATVLVNRHLTTPEKAGAFLKPSLAHITPPETIKDMPEAARRLARALVEDERILVFGDYDVDGITATALLLDFLRQAGGRVAHYIPHRRKEGYGLKASHIFQRILPGDYQLVVTVDCGISSHEAVQAAVAAGIDIIITDHHQPPAGLPEALAVINPKRTDCSAGLDHLAGVGMAFYLLIELRRRLREGGFWQTRPEPNLKALCNLVALGTIADMVPLVAENRAFIRCGLEAMAERPGLKALMDVSRVAPERLEAADVGFRLAPRLNAAGRMAHANLALRLLTTRSTRRAQRIARTLDRLNARRQQTERTIVDQIRQHLATQPELLENRALVMAGRDWHEGVLGIVAARLAHDYARPVVLLSHNGSLARGSARSIPGIDLYRLLAACQDHLTRFGGHAMAAGLSLPAKELAAFEQRLQRYLWEETQPEDYRPRLSLDAEIVLDQITPHLLDQLEALQPFGQAIPEPLFMLRDVTVDACEVVGDHHRRMILKSASSAHTARVRAIHFNVDACQAPPKRFDRLAGHLRWNRWNNTQTPQLVIVATDPETARRP
jgi:single-stranded-DNA-specific exonuclease